MLIKRRIYCIILFLLTITSKAQKGVNTITDEGAWCWFADPRATSHINYLKNINNSYIGYVDVHGNIKATQINYTTKTKNEILIRSYFQPDDHNNPTFLILPDDRVMVFYSRHTDEACFYYRISQKPGDLTTLGHEFKLLTKDNTTYPSPFILSDDPDHIYLCWRGINWHPSIGRLNMPDKDDNVKFDWGPFQIVRSNKNYGSGVRPYAKYVSNNKDKIFLAYTTTHPDNQSINYLYLNYININSKELKDISNNVLSTIGGDTLHNVNASQQYKEKHPDAVIDDSPYRNWLWEVALAPNDKPVIASVSISEDKKKHSYFLISRQGNKWKKTFIADAGGHFHQTPNIENCYSAGIALDKANPYMVYASVPIKGYHGKIYELKKFMVSSNGNVKSREQITFNSSKNNVRPFVIPGSKSTTSLIWMYGDYYDWIVSYLRPKAYATSIRTTLQMPALPVKSSQNLVKKVSHSEIRVKNIISLPNLKSFTIFADISAFDKIYNGELLEFAGLSYFIPNIEMPRPYIVFNSKSWYSTNVLGTSDGWEKINRGTSGQWVTPTRFSSLQLAITYSNGILRSYVNGLLDQYIEIPYLVLSQINLKNLYVEYNGMSIYSRELSQDEIKAHQNR